MRRWDRLLDAYVERYRAWGLSEQTVGALGGTAGTMGTLTEEASSPCFD